MGLGEEVVVTGGARGLRGRFLDDPALLSVWEKD